ncbi:MAG TPA: prepilin-type N-terminal cleavage/methylation domain-containing protein [Gemmatimonadales bacterium]|nr:prepilin-type N-terminal cleavage/methylation domain-containing protein [Gemmatimonadales bacterium]
MSRRGFTLIEILIVIVIIGILASIAVPKFANTKDKAYIGQMKSDLRNLATAEEAFFFDSSAYTNDFTKMNNYNPSVGINVVVNEHTPQGWSATATTPNNPLLHCDLFSGAAAPVGAATIEGRITCQ